MKIIQGETKAPGQDGLPPFVSSWPQLYALLIITLGLLIGSFYLFMIHFQ